MRIITICVAAILSLALVACDDSKKTETKPATPPAPTAPKPAAPEAPTTQISEAVPPRPTNTKCAISGEDIDLSDPKLIIADYKGKSYGLCCKDCLDTFNKNPEKYASAK